MKQGFETSEWRLTMACVAFGAMLVILGAALLWVFPPYAGLVLAGLGTALIVSASRDYVGSRSDAKQAEAHRDRPVYAPRDSIELRRVKS